MLNKMHRIFILFGLLCIFAGLMDTVLSATSKPTAKPTVRPTVRPTAPTVKPTAKPTSPTLSPSVKPTVAPTVAPSFNPTSAPSSSWPTSRPSSTPSKNPTPRPTPSTLISPATLKEAMKLQFFNFDGLYDKSWFMFILVTLFSATCGKNYIFTKLGVPVITGYMLMGFLCGPYALKLMSILQISELTYVNNAALSFIAFSAGAEIYLPEIVPLFKTIMWVSFFMILFTMIFGTIFTYSVFGTPLLTWMTEKSGCSLGVSMLVATILSARSPTSVLAVVRELHASGPVTHVMIGITVAGDVFVLTIFAIVQSMTFGMCSGQSFDPVTFSISLGMIPLAFIWGWALGYVLKLVIFFKRLKHLILPIGFLTVLTCNYILKLSLAKSKYSIDIDSLLVCIMAGFIAGNDMKVRDRFVKYLKGMSMYVFIPFFTLVGLQINLPVLISTIGFAFSASIVRAACMCMGTYIGGRKAGLPGDKAFRLWMGLLPQAGVSLGLAGIIGEQFGTTFGRNFQSTMVGVILVNQIIGPIGAKFLIKYCHEDNQGDEHDGHEMKQTALALNDGHMDHHVEPKLADTQTENDIFSFLCGSLLSSKSAGNEENAFETAVGTDVPLLTEDGNNELNPISTEGGLELPPVQNVDVDITSNPMITTETIGDAHAEYGIPHAQQEFPLSDLSISLPEKKFTKGGIEIIDMTGNQDRLLRLRSARRQRTDDVSLLKDIVSSNFSSFTRNTREIFGLGGGSSYSAVNTSEDGQSQSQESKGGVVGTFNLLVSKVFEKDGKND